MNQKKPAIYLMSRAFFGCGGRICSRTYIEPERLTGDRIGTQLP